MNNQPLPLYDRAKAHLNDSLINASIDSLVAFDTNLCIIAWNDTTALWTGLQRDAVLGKSLPEIFPEAYAIAGLAEALQNTLKGFKTFLPPAGGFYLPGHYEAHFVPLLDEGGTVTGVLQILHDVAHRIKVENELKALNQQLSRRFMDLERANRELATFARIASHDLKEPLRKIYTFAEMILMHEASKLSNSGRSNFRRIQKSVQRMGLLTDDIANFTELTTGNMPLVQTDLQEVLFRAIEPLRETIAQTEAILVTSGLCHMPGYEIPLVQMFRQLTGNALKFQPKDNKPVISIHYEIVRGSQLNIPEAAQESNYYSISFRDNGIGFDPVYSDRIFGMFQRLHPEGEYKGSGVGLTIARKVAELHGGFMSAESNPGTGSTFYCYLPAES